MCICLGEVGHLFLMEEEYCILLIEILGLRSLSWTGGGRCRLTECLFCRELGSIWAQSVGDPPPPAYLQRSPTSSGSSSSMDSSLSEVSMGFVHVTFVGEVSIRFSVRRSSLAMALTASLGMYTNNSSVEAISASDKSEADPLNCTHLHGHSAGHRPGPGL